MLVEVILMWLVIGTGVLTIGIPLTKLVRAILPEKEKNPLEEAKKRLEQARLDAAAAKLNKETEKLYDHMYEDALAEREVEEDNETYKQERK